MSTTTVIDNTGKAVAIDSLPQTLTWNGPGGAVDTITAIDPVSGARWVQTLTYSGSNLTGISAWTRK